MGIRGLLHMLQPYRVVIDFPLLADRDGNQENFSTEHRDETSPNCDAAPHRREEPHHDAPPSPSSSQMIQPRSASSRVVVLDGPALAYHAYALALGRRRGSARNALEAMPGYGEVGRIAVLLLDTLRMHGMAVAAIFFDGALPDAKREVRMQRLTAYLRQLENYRTQPQQHASSNVSASSDDALLREATPSELFSTAHSVPAKLKMLPALPFLVPSVIETLRASDYSNRTVVVPGEADYFCAAYAKEHHAMIVSSDSDLLVYDLGSGGSVTLFKDIEQSLMSGSSCLKVATYDIATILQRLNLNTLQEFACVLDEDPHLSFNSCLEQAYRLQSNPSLAYREFAARYSTENLPKESFIPATTASSVLQSLDPRISEWIHDGHNLELLTLPTELKTALEDRTAFPAARLYLPVLIEDTNRSGAWDVGWDVRRLAYSCVRPVTTRRPSTVEIMRRGDRIVEVNVEHLDLGDVSGGLERFQGIVNRVNSAAVHNTLCWPFIALYLLCHHAISDEKKLPSRKTLHALLVRRRPSNDWEFVQWSAQLQAASYSIRILHQFLAIALTWKSGFALTHVVQATIELLQTLPSLSTWFDEDTTIDEAAVSRTVDQLFGVLGVDESHCQPKPASMTKRQRKQEKKRQRTEPRARNVVDTGHSSSSSSNMFVVLPAGR